MSMHPHIEKSGLQSFKDSEQFTDEEVERTMELMEKVFGIKLTYSYSCPDVDDDILFSSSRQFVNIAVTDMNDNLLYDGGLMPHEWPYYPKCKYGCVMTDKDKLLCEKDFIYLMMRQPKFYRIKQTRLDGVAFDVGMFELYCTLPSFTTYTELLMKLELSGKKQ